MDGHRSDLVILKTARAQAAFEGRKAISDHDIALAAELALPHRIRRGPFQQNEIGVEELQERISQLQGQQTGDGKEDKQSLPDDESQDAGDEKKRRRPDRSK